MLGFEIEVMVKCLIHVREKVSMILLRVDDEVHIVGAVSMIACKFGNLNSLPTVSARIVERNLITKACCNSTSVPSEVR